MTRVLIEMNHSLQMIEDFQVDEVKGQSQDTCEELEGFEVDYEVVLQELFSVEQT